MGKKRKALGRHLHLRVPTSTIFLENNILLDYFCRSTSIFYYYYQNFDEKKIAAAPFFHFSFFIFHFILYTGATQH